MSACHVTNNNGIGGIDPSSGGGGSSSVNYYSSPRNGDNLILSSSQPTVGSTGSLEAAGRQHSATRLGHGGPLPTNHGGPPPSSQAARLRFERMHARSAGSPRGSLWTRTVSACIGSGKTRRQVPAGDGIVSPAPFFLISLFLDARLPTVG